VALPHYGAPAVCLFYFIVIQCMRKVYFLCWRTRAIGKLLVWSVPLYYSILIACLVFVGLNPSLILAQDPIGSKRHETIDWSFRRARLVKNLNKQEGKFLVIVKYLQRHEMHQEWVYNDADIDNAKVVWARSMGVKKDCELINYFSDRNIWFLSVDNNVRINKDVNPSKLCQ
jgi:hypothetical protein